MMMHRPKAEFVQGVGQVKVFALIKPSPPSFMVRKWKSVIVKIREQIKSDHKTADRPDKYIFIRSFLEF